MKYIKLFESYFEDLTPYTYGRGGNKVNIGWLDKDDFTKGEVSSELIEKIKGAPVAERYKGWHSCPFCDPSNGRPERCSTNQEIEGNGKTYIFPSLLPHYIEKHKYLPPQEFLDAIDKMKIAKKIEEKPIFRRKLKGMDESIFDLWKSPLKDWNKDSSDSKEVRVSLNEKDFKGLCDNGYIINNHTKIEIDMDNFVELIGGSIITINKNKTIYKIALQDLGLNSILHYSEKSPYYG